MLYCIIDIDDCLPHPCQHGTCQDLHNAYKCTCNPGYTGTNCETGNMMHSNEIGENKKKIHNFVLFYLVLSNIFICLYCFISLNFITLSKLILAFYLAI